MNALDLNNYFPTVNPAEMIRGGISSLRLATFNLVCSVELIQETCAPRYREVFEILLQSSQNIHEMINPRKKTSHQNEIYMTNIYEVWQQLRRFEGVFNCLKEAENDIASDDLRAKDQWRKICATFESIKTVIVSNPAFLCDSL